MRILDSGRTASLISFFSFFLFLEKNVKLFESICASLVNDH